MSKLLSQRITTDPTMIDPTKRDTVLVDGELVPSSLAVIFPILRVAKEVERENPMQPGRFHASKKAHKTYPTLSGKGMVIIEEEDSVMAEVIGNSLLHVLCIQQVKDVYDPGFLFVSNDYQLWSKNCIQPPEDIVEVTNVQASSSNSKENQLLVTNVPATPEVDFDNQIVGLPRCSAELKPALWMKFVTLEEGIHFYEEYAKVCGFLTRLDSTKLVDGIVTHKWRVCNNQGKSSHKGTKRKRTLTRIGCQAKVSFRRIQTGEYEIYDFVEVHSHAMNTPTTMIHLKPCRNLNLVHKKMIMDNAHVNHGPVQTFRMFKQYVKGYKNVGASLQDFKNFSRDVKKYIKEYDAQMLIENFMQKKAMSPSFYFDFDVDDQSRITKLFWADPISIKNYALFGDAISVDSTYNFNQYKMVFVPFTGVDNHKGCVTFAASLIRNENAESFSWLFQNFVTAMGDRYPITMFERIGILCRHILWVLKDRGFDHIPKEYLALRWSKSATSHPLSLVVGKICTSDCVSIESRENNISELWSESGKSKDKKAEIEMLLGSKIPTEVTVLPPEKCKNKGSGKRITSNKEKAVLENAKPLRKCRACGEMSNHDSRNCPSRLP
ncbi:uncharacterized protein LOC141649559 [Silene latifolia]|uniref:uncharacterized protein LOC141649559 n=1 Tax=Silene latifolia TaxID=37657 RepID=UPI003D76AD8B